MTRIYEALQLAQQDKLVVNTADHVMVPVQEYEDPVLNERFLQVYANIESTLEGVESKLIQFIGTSRNDGASVLIHRMAKFLSKKVNKRTLLITAHSTDHVKHLTPDSGRDVKHLDDAPERLNSNLFVSSSAQYFNPYEMKNDGEYIQTAIKQLKENYQYILVDSPPLSQSIGSLLLSGKTDGVVLVIEAEKVKAQALEESIAKIRANGGKVIGSILNKRKFYIPGLLYKYL